MAEKKPDPKYDGNEFWTEYRLIEPIRALEVYGEAPKKEGDPDLTGEVVSYLIIGSGKEDTWEVAADEFHARYRPMTPVKR